MKLLLDQGTPLRAAELLRTAGHDCVHVGECGLETADDSALLQKGRDESAVVVTMDADFHALLALSNASAPSVIRFRVESLKTAEFTALLFSVLSKCGDDLDNGAMVTVQ